MKSLQISPLCGLESRLESFRNRKAGSVLLLLSLSGLLATSCTSLSEKEVSANKGITVCGTVQYTGTCGEEVDSLISYGLALVHHMTYEDAEMVFDRVIEAQPECFWGHWGKALTFIHPLWPDQPGEEKMKLGWELSQKAISFTADPKEKAYGQALAAYFENGLSKTEKERLKNYEVGWKEAYELYPDELELKAFYALSLIATAETSDKTYQNQMKAGALAEAVLQAIPDHPGGFHYIIHAYDSPELRAKALEAARNYSKIAPDIPHALHMPTHIFTREGLWDESIDWNTRSAKAALANPVNGAISMHYFHALDYMVYAYLQKLESQKANSILEEIRSLTGPYQNVAATAYTLAAIEGRYALERQEWKSAAAIQARQPAHFQWDNFPEFEALTHFAIGIGAARSGSVAKADETVKKLEELEQKITNEYWAQQVRIQRTSVEAWLAFAKGKKTEALDKMTFAAKLESGTSKHAVTPGELLPAAELLGDMLLELNQPQEAIAHYEKSLERSPGRFNSLYGAARAAELSGDNAKAKAYYETLVGMSEKAEKSFSRREQALSFLSAL